MTPGKKTNVLRLLEAEGIAHQVHVYDPSQWETDLREGGAASRAENIFKTLVTSGGGNLYFVFCLPLSLELNWRKATEVAGTRKIGLIPQDNLLDLTGYERGGCSPLAMKKAFPTFLDETALLFDTILISAGARGLQVELAPADLLALGARLLPRFEVAVVT
ncbi:MAG: aminoacyl-tRNA deacylase [Spirochaetales bacterium]